MRITLPEKKARQFSRKTLNVLKWSHNFASRTGKPYTKALRKPLISQAGTEEATCISKTQLTILSNNSHSNSKIGLRRMTSSKMKS